MSLKIHFFDSHLNFSSENPGDVTVEQGKCFYQDISTLETQHQEKCNPKMMADNSRKLKMDVPQTRKKIKSKLFLNDYILYVC